mgnify:CR=1 FL=1
MNEEPAYLSSDALAARYGVTRKTVYNWKNSGRLPQPVQLGPNIVRWRRDEIEQYEAEAAAARSAA